MRARGNADVFFFLGEAEEDHSWIVFGHADEVHQPGREAPSTGPCHVDGVRLIRAARTPWIKDDEGAFAVELKWLNMPGTAERNLFVVISHDEEQRRQHVEARRRRRWLGVMWFCRAMAKNLPRVPCYSQAFRVRQVGIERG